MTPPCIEQYHQPVTAKSFHSLPDKTPSTVLVFMSTCKQVQVHSPSADLPPAALNSPEISPGRFETGSDFLEYGSCSQVALPGAAAYH